MIVNGKTWIPDLDCHLEDIGNNPSIITQMEKSSVNVRSVEGHF